MDLPIRRKMDICFDGNGSSIVTEMDDYTNGYENIQKRGGKIRCITEITPYNIKYCNKLYNLVDELCHLDGLRRLAVNDI